MDKERRAGKEGWVRTAASRSWILRSSRPRSASVSRPGAPSASAAACAAGNAGVTVGQSTTCPDLPDH